MPVLQNKRSEECMQSLPESPGKIPKIAVQDDSIELSVSYAVSGKKIAQLKISKESSVADLKKSVKQHVQPGNLIQDLLKDDTVLENDSVLRAVAENGAEIKVV